MAWGKLLEEFLICNNMCVMNDATACPTFQSNRGKSRVDLTITNQKLVRQVVEWQCGVDESCSDHKLLSFNITGANTEVYETSYMGIRYLIKQDNYVKFLTSLTNNFIHTFNCVNKSDRIEIDKELREKSDQYNAEKFTQYCFSCITEACNTAFRKSTGNKQFKGRTVPWWTT